MNELGAKFVKTDGFDIYFDVKIGSEMDDQNKLIKARDILKNEFFLTLKIKKVK